MRRLPANSEERYEMKMFFDRVYSTLGDVMVTFNMTNFEDVADIKEIIEQYDNNYTI